MGCVDGFECGCFLALGEGDEHGDALFVVFVCSAVECGEVAFFELDCDEDVGAGCDGEDEVCDCHVGRSPEGEEPADVEGVADEAVEPGGAELELGVFGAAEVEPDLTEAEEVEVVDEEGAEQDDEPAEDADGVEDGFGCGIFNVPDCAAHGLPQPEHGDHGDA